MNAGRMTTGALTGAAQILELELFGEDRLDPPVFHGSPEWAAEMLVPGIYSGYGFDGADHEFQVIIEIGREHSIRFIAIERMK